MNHSFACAKDAQNEPPCLKWCGNKHTCLSTRTYGSDALQEAYEKGHHDAKWAMENELASMAQSTSPHRRVAAEDFYRALCNIRAVAFDIAPTSEGAQACRYTNEPGGACWRKGKAVELCTRHGMSEEEFKASAAAHSAGVPVTPKGLTE